MSKQINVVSLDQLVNENHQYKKFKELFDFKAVEKELVAVEKDNNYKECLKTLKILLLAQHRAQLLYTLA